MADKAVMWRTLLEDERELLWEEKKQRGLSQAKSARLKEIEMNLAGLSAGAEPVVKRNFRDEGVAALDAQIAALKAKIASCGAGPKKA